VWDLRYVDAPVVRFHDANTDGDLLDAGDNTLYYLNDANMNVTALVDASNGNVVERYHYDPYGNVIVMNGGWTQLNPNASYYDNDYLYTGRRLDTESGLFYYRARYYDAALGSFLQRDPIGYSAGDSNLRRYVENGPVSATDPEGLQARGRRGGGIGRYQRSGSGRNWWGGTRAGRDAENRPMTVPARVQMGREQSAARNAAFARASRVRAQQIRAIRDRRTEEYIRARAEEAIKGGYTSREVRELVNALRNMFRYREQMQRRGIPPAPLLPANGPGSYQHTQGQRPRQGLPSLEELARRGMLMGGIPNNQSGTARRSDVPGAGRTGQGQQRPPAPEQRSGRPGSDPDARWRNPDGSIRWPPNQGFDGEPVVETLKPCTLIDRYGPLRGRFTAPKGTSIPQRSLAPGTVEEGYHLLEVVKPLRVRAGKIAPWFDQPGGGIQYRLERSVPDLIREGFLKIVE